MRYLALVLGLLVVSVNSARAQLDDATIEPFGFANEYYGVNGVGGETSYVDTTDVLQLRSTISMSTSSSTTVYWRYEWIDLYGTVVDTDEDYFILNGDWSDDIFSDLNPPSAGGTVTLVISVGSVVNNEDEEMSGAEIDFVGD